MIPAVTQPIFNAGKIRANVRVQEALRQQAMLTYQQTVLTALQEVESALIAYAKDQEHRAGLADAVAPNRTAVELSTRLYTAGELDFLNLLTAQRNLYTSEDALVQADRATGLPRCGVSKGIGAASRLGQNGSERELRMTARKLVVLMLLALPMAVIGASGALGQATSSLGEYIQPETINVTFPFQVGDKTLPAGKYSIEQPTRELLIFRSAKGPAVEAPVITRLAQPATPLVEPKVIFDEVGDKFIASEVWIPGWDGFLLTGTKAVHTHHEVKTEKKNSTTPTSAVLNPIPTANDMMAMPVRSVSGITRTRA